MSTTYAAIKAISEPDAMEALLSEEVIKPVLESVSVKKVRPMSGRRFEAPRALWNVYEAHLELPDGTEVRPLFWTKALFNDVECEQYRSRISWTLRHRRGNPLDPQGYAKEFPDRNLFVFFFPTDPTFPSLPTVFDPQAMAPLLEPHFLHLRPGSVIRSIIARRIKYLPEISCIVRYDADIGEERPLTIYGKVQHSRRGAFTYDVMKALWELPARVNGELIVSEPLAYYPDLDLILQSEVPGEEVPGDRHSEVFRQESEVAGRVVAFIHDSGISVGSPHTVDVEINRLADRLEQFKMSSPRVYFALRDLLKQIRAHAERIPPENPVPSHGDYKYNQFLFDGQRYGLIDVEFFVQAEPSFDLGKYCGHIFPSVPKDWSDSAAANDARRIFLDAYSAVRPQYRGARFPLYEALSLATRSLVVTWTQGRNWEYTADTLIALSYEKLKSRWGE
jgi:hypothetical protein